MHPPAVPGVQFADIVGGAMQAVTRILLALLWRERTGLGQRIDVSMVDGLKPLLTLPQASSEVAARLSGRYACYRVYPARGGSWLSVGALETKFWSNLCVALGCPDLIADQFAEEPRQSEVQRAIASALAARTAEEWFELLKSADCCVAPVRGIPALEPASGDVPMLGQHTEELLPHLA